MSSITSSVEHAEVAAVSPAASESLSSSTTTTVMPSQKKAKKAKLKAVVAAVAATQAEEENKSSVDHPYLSVLHKRIRSHRKKLEKIKGLEQAQAKEKKVLNAQQLELMSNKAPLEKLVVELEMLREQFASVYTQELEQKQQQEEQKAVGAIPDEAEQVKKDEEDDEGNAKQEGRTSSMEEKEKETVEQVVAESETTDVFANVYELLKTLHVVNLHQSMHKEVPMVLDFFSKVLLGNTRPPAELSYEENLMESFEEAKKYLTKSDKVFACDTTYSSLRAFVDQLAITSSKKSEGDEEKESVLAEPIDDKVATVAEENLHVPVVPAEINTMPQISFFTDSQLEPEQDDDATVEVEVAELQVEATETIATETQDEPVCDGVEKDEVQIEEEVVVPAETLPVAVKSVLTPPLSFAAVAAGVSSECTPSPSTSSISSSNDKKEAGVGGSSPRSKNSRRRGQGRWKEKGSNSNSGDNKAGNGSLSNGGKPRRSRAPRVNGENSIAQGSKRSGLKEGGRPRVDRGLRKQGDSSQQHTTPMIAPHA